MLEPRIQQQFIDSADLHYQLAQQLAAPIASAVQAVLASVTNGGKLLACGSGASAALAQQAALFFVAGFERERPGLAALALGPWPGASAGDGLARQVHALGVAGDLLLAISGEGEEQVLLDAVRAAQGRELTVVVLCGRDEATWAGVLRETDVLIGVAHERAARVRELHALVLHCLCDGVDTQLLGEQERML